MRFEDFLLRREGNPATRSQIALLRRIALALEASSDCAGAVLVGSFARESADRLSDIDLVVFCAEGSGHAVFETIRQQIAPAEIVFTFDGTHNAGSPYQKLIFGDLTSLEFHVFSPDAEFTLEHPFVEVVNREDCLASRTSSRLASNERDMTAFHSGDRYLAWELLSCLKWVLRGDYATARRYLVNLGKAIEASGQKTLRE
jgi:predicted nucleotidyltransferase